MKEYLAAIMTGMLLLGTSPVLFAGERTPASVQEKRMQDDYHKRKSETKAYRADYKKQNEALKAKRAAERKAKKSSSGKK